MQMFVGEVTKFRVRLNYGFWTPDKDGNTGEGYIKES